MVTEQAVCFRCAGEELLGVLSTAPGTGKRGVLVVVGGPQYRVGSHRQFTLLARELAQRGIPVFRFDYRGMGDSGGGTRTFEDVGEDIRCAIGSFFETVPGLQDVALWGLCDGASAALLYAHRDRRVSGLALLNPWVHTEQRAARVFLRHYYLWRLLQPSLWKKIVGGDFKPGQALREFGKFVVSAITGGSRAGPAENAPLPERMQDGLRRFGGRVLLVLSGDDLVAMEFINLVAASEGWQALLDKPAVTRHQVAGANHTFSRRNWRDEVATCTEQWLKSW